MLICEQAIVYSGTIIWPGFKIGIQAKIGANSLVNKDVDDYSFFAGVPAKMLKQIGNFKKNDKLE